MNELVPHPPASLDHGRIVLGEPLGAGAQAAVFAATRSGEAIAVKLVHSSKVSPRFAGEAKALRAVHHPHIVKVIDWGHDGEWHWIAMERLHGRTLDVLLTEDGALPPPEALRVIFAVLTGLAALHHRGIVHRDIKPSNVFATDDGRVVIGDLGVAKLPAGDVGYLTTTGASVGTLDYAAPEQLGEARWADPRADLYGAGALLFVLLTASRPAYLYAQEDYPQAYERLPNAFRPLIARACSHSPDDRFPSARAMAEEVAGLGAPSPGDAASWMEGFDEASPLPPFWLRAWLGLRRFLA